MFLNPAVLYQGLSALLAIIKVTILREYKARVYAILNEKD